MFGHAKFVNSPNVQLNPSNAENVYSGSEDKTSFKTCDFNQANLTAAVNPTYENGGGQANNQHVYMTMGDSQS